jgi:hypothetical protein
VAVGGDTDTRQRRLLLDTPPTKPRPHAAASSPRRQSPSRPRPSVSRSFDELESYEVEDKPRRVRTRSVPRIVHAASDLEHDAYLTDDLESSYRPRRSLSQQSLTRRSRLRHRDLEPDIAVPLALCSSSSRQPILLIPGEDETYQTATPYVPGMGVGGGQYSPHRHDAQVVYIPTPVHSPFRGEFVYNDHDEDHASQDDMCSDNEGRSPGRAAHQAPPPPHRSATSPAVIMEAGSTLKQVGKSRG